MVQLSHLYGTMGKPTALTIWMFAVHKVMSLIFDTLSRFVMAFLPRSKSLNFMAAVTVHHDFGTQENKICHCFYFFPFYLPWSDGTKQMASIQSLQLLNHVQLLASPWTAACQASLSITNSRSLLKLMSIESVMPSNHLILCHPFLLLPSIFPSIRIFSNELVLCIRWPNIGVSASASVLLMNIQDWFPLGLTGWISLQSKGLSRVFSNTTVQKHQFFGAQLSLS